LDLWNNEILFLEAKMKVVIVKVFYCFQKGYMSHQQSTYSIIIIMLVQHL
jgi:hypothetical protein